MLSLITIIHTKMVLAQYIRHSLFNISAICTCAVCIYIYTNDNYHFNSTQHYLVEQNIKSVQLIVKLSTTLCEWPYQLQVILSHTYKNHNSKV